MEARIRGRPLFLFEQNGLPVELIKTRFCVYFTHECNSSNGRESESERASAKERERASERVRERERERERARERD